MEVFYYSHSHKIIDVWNPHKSQISPISSDFDIKSHLHVEKVLVLSQVARHLLLSLMDILLQLTYPCL